ncbi:MAG: hypothetical protein ABR973_12400 [Candidatus Acidiferrales bacterium]
MLFHKDIEDALRMKAEKPVAFKSSARAQKLAAYSDEHVRWMIALTKESIRAFETRPPALQDLSIAADRKRKPKERLAAIDRFARSFGEIPNNVALTLFRWLDAEKRIREVRSRAKDKETLEQVTLEAQGRKDKLTEALGAVTLTLKMNQRTGELDEIEKRGAKQTDEMRHRLNLLARRLNEGVSEGEMAIELFPGLPQKEAYARTRDLRSKHRYLIELLRHGLQVQSRSPQKPCR